MHQCMLSCEAPNEHAQQNLPDQVEAEKHLFGHTMSLVDLIPSPVRYLERTGEWHLFSTSGCIRQATKIASIISPNFTNHSIAVTVLMPAVDYGTPTSHNFTLQPLTGFKPTNYECSWKRNVSPPSGHNHRHEELPRFGSSVFKSHCTLWTKKMGTAFRSQDFYSIATIIIGKFPIIGPVVANKPVSDEGQAQMKYKNQHKTQNRWTLSKFHAWRRARSWQELPSLEVRNQMHKGKEWCLFPKWHSAPRKLDMVPPAAPNHDRFDPNNLTDAGPTYS